MTYENKPFSKLRGRIKEVFGTQERFAAAIGMNTATLSKKLNLIAQWTREEMQLACIALAIPIDQVHLYFFTQEVA